MAHEIFIELSYDSAATTADSAHSISNPQHAEHLSPGGPGILALISAAEPNGREVRHSHEHRGDADAGRRAKFEQLGATHGFDELANVRGAPNKSTPPIPRIPSANDMRARTAAGVRQIGWLSMQHLPRR
jgi:hypothetical protein